MAGKPERSGGRRKGAGRKPGDLAKDPRAIMVDSGYAKHWLSPVEFCLALMNADYALIHGKNMATPDGKPVDGKEFTISQRIEAARIAAPFMHQKLPHLVEQNVTHSWADVMQEAENRLSTMRQPHEPPRQDDRVH